MVDGSDHMRLAVRIGAIRQTFETAGMVVAGNPPPGFARQELQQVLLREGPVAFPAFLDDWGIRLRPQGLEGLGCFLVPDRGGAHAGAAAAHFFLARVPDAEEPAWARAVSVEVDRLCWATPSQALRLHQQGGLELPPVQWYLLHALRSGCPRLSDLPDFLARARTGRGFAAFGEEPVALELLRESGAAAAGAAAGAGGILVLPGDAEHSSCPGPAGHRRRLLVEGSARLGFRVLGAEEDPAGREAMPAAAPTARL